MQLKIALRAGCVALLLALVAIATMPARAQEATEQTALISMSGTGTVTAPPDMAIVTTGTVSQAETAQDALAANNAAMGRIIATLKSAGIAARDIATSGFNVSPVYSQYRPKPGEEARPPRVVGYRVSNAVTIRVRDLASLGTVLDKVVDDGANAINGIRFTVDDDEELRDEARRKAVADAIRKARIIAEAAGVKLGRIMSITESSDIRAPAPMMRMARAEAAMDSAVPVETGEQSLRVNVAITWEIAQ